MLVKTVGIDPGRLACHVVALVMINLAVGWTPARADTTDSCPETPHRLEAFSLFAAALDRSKQILAYLPPGYDCAKTRRYPVFYFNDGQDLFDWNPFTAPLDPALASEIAEREAWYGSWRLERQLDRAITEGELRPMIVIGIASDDGMRSRDLVPVPWDGSSEGRGTDYGDFVAQTVVAATDRRFRTAVDRRCRGIGGASLGGISALQIGLAHPDRFGLVLAFSPVFRDRAIADYFAAAWAVVAYVGTSAFLIDFDDDPIGTADLKWFASMARTATRGRQQLAMVQTPGGHHTIASWAERVVPALNRLFEAQCSD